jgi:hypothetical protein
MEVPTFNPEMLVTVSHGVSKKKDGLLAVAQNEWCLKRQGVT